MANFNLNGIEENPTQPQSETISSDSNSNSESMELDNSSSLTENEGINEIGMSYEELNDANKIKVTISDSQAPLVVFFGSPSCGKTMTLIRLTRYLKGKAEYSVIPDTAFRPNYDTNYKEMCKNFDLMISSEDAAQSTSKINFMLIKVICNGKTLCQILEGPGEYYFDPSNPQAKFPKNVNAIINSPNRKIWAIMVEPDQTNDRMGTEERRCYVDKIRYLKTKMSPRDKVIFVYNKIDVDSQFIVNATTIKDNLVMKHTKELYPNIFVNFMNMNPITKWWNPFNFDFVTFQSGDFQEANDGKLTYQESSDYYPQKLWKAILKGIK